MDPEITWGEFQLARREGRDVDAAEHALNLAEWIDKGGAVPDEMQRLNPEFGRRHFVKMLMSYAI
jgi:hypothetical protein